MPDYQMNIFGGWEEVSSNKKVKKVNKAMVLKKISAIVLLAIYVNVIINLTINFVPYKETLIFVSKQNVPHTEVVGNGYDNIWEISGNIVYKDSNPVKCTTVDTPQLITNLVLSTIIAGTIYFLFIFKKNKSRVQIDEQELKMYLPDIDLVKFAFADEKTQIRAQKEYVEAVYRYVKSKIDGE